MTRLLAILLFAATVAGADDGPWENLNPGGGGQVQSVDLDPNIEGRLYLCSDMEGAYRSDDHGETWHYLGDAMHDTDALTMCVTSNRLLCGTSEGVEISDDAGKTWRRAKGIENDPVMRIVANSDDVFAGPGWRWRWDEQHGRTIGERNIYVSRDRGATWKSVNYAGTPGRREVFTINVRSRQIILGAITGIFISNDAGNTWQPMAGPAGTGDCLGAELSPDGKILYAFFQVTPRRVTWKGGIREAATRTELFATPLDKPAWVNVSAPDKGFDQSLIYWRPVIDPRSDGQTHRLLAAPFVDRAGLHGLTIHWDNGVVKDYRWKRIFYYGNGGSTEFDSGWEMYSTRPLHWAYAPVTWSKRWIWTTGDQTLFSVDASQPGFESKWQVKYCRPVKTVGDTRFYRTRGYNSTFVFDANAFSNYCAQGNADNGILESYDNGFSWALADGPSRHQNPRCNSIAICRDIQPPMVIAHTSTGFGAASTEGRLWARPLDTLTRADKWLQLAGGEDWKTVRLPNRIYTQIVPDPHKPGRVYIGTFDHGIFTVENIRELYDAIRDGKTPPRVSSPTKYAPVPKPAEINEKGHALVVDPDRPDTLWVCSKGILYRGNKTGEDWTWTQIRKEENTKTIYMDLWKHDGRRYLVVSVNQRLEMSTDDGKTWRTVLEFSNVESLRQNPWHRPELHRYDIYGLTGHGNQVFAAYADWDNGAKPYGIFRGTIQPAGNVVWEDFTANLHYPFPVRTKVLEVGGDRYLYVATRGNGLWRRKLQ